MVAGAPSSHVSAAFCCIVYAIACPAILFTLCSRMLTLQHALVVLQLLQRPLQAACRVLHIPDTP
jgi:hypothetical protein